MTDTVKTSIFAVTGLLLVAIAWLVSPRAVDPNVTTQADSGKLFEAFEGEKLPEPRRLKIVRYDDSSRKIKDFEVQLIDGVWVIPSHDDYPSDASDQLADTTVAIMQAEIVGIASKKDDPNGDEETEITVEDQRLYGVVEPTEEELRLNKEGLGTLVLVEGEGGKKVAHAVIGKEVEGNSELHYARRVGEDRVYEVKVDTSKLSPQFEDWIEADLLNLDGNDISEVTLNDYTLDLDSQGNPIQQRAIVELKRENSVWDLVEMVSLRRGKMKKGDMAIDEELNTEKLNDLRTALDDLEIVNVKRKPKALAKSLRLGRLELDQEGATALAGAGFYALRIPSGGVGLFSENGEVSFATTKGVMYLLRFGNVQDADEQGEDGELELRRYLFVTADLDPLAVPEPEYQELPKDPAQGDTVDEAELAAERKRIQQKNDELKAEWEEKVKDIQVKVRDLNDRFADWFFVVSEDTYQKIHLGRNDIIVESQNAADTGFGVDAFRKLEEGGIDPPEETPPPRPGGPGGFPGGPGGFPGGFPGGPGGPR